MEIEIRSATRLSEIQENFKKRFPFLDIKFFQKKKEDDPQYTAHDVLDASLTVKEASGSKPEDPDEPVEINGSMTVGQVEELFAEKLNLHTEVFRKSGKIWLLTSATDHWTLAEQNSVARDNEKTIVDKSEPTDYHEQE